jgi:ATP-dependent DNA ligase
MPLTFYFWKASTSVNRRRSSASASSRCCSRKPKLQSPILYSDYLLSDGNEMVAHSCRLGVEGIISKNAEAPYRSDRDEDLLKIKCVQKGKFPVIGFVKDPTGVAALYLEKREGKSCGT